MTKDDDELNALISKNSRPGDEWDDPVEDDFVIRIPRGHDRDHPAAPPTVEVDEDGEPVRGKVVQWSTGDGIIFVPTGAVQKLLTPGAYTIGISNQLGLYFEQIPVKTEKLLRLPSTNLHKVTAEISKFWDLEKRFGQYNLAHKRGILLWGPAGCGKSSCIQLLMEDVIVRGGIVINFSNPILFLEGYRSLRLIQPETPVVVIMEDLDAILRNWEESTVLNILDGFESMRKTVFVGTTNYPERLGPRVVNRPSRFDKRFKVGFPNPESRRQYLNFLAVDEPQVSVNRWVKDTEGFSLAHLKELFTAVVVLGDDYKEAVATLQSMIDVKITSDSDSDPGEDEAPSTDGPGQYL